MFRWPLLPTSRAGGLARPCHVHESAGQLELGRETAPALHGEVEAGEPHDRVAQLVDAEVPGLAERLLGREGVHLEPARGIPRTHALGRECLARADLRDVTRERADDAGQLARRALQQRLGGLEDSGDVAPAPGVREREDRRLRAGDGELLDVADADLVALRPRRELVHLGPERLEILSDELRERAARLGLGRRAAALQLGRDPGRQVPLARSVVDENLTRFGARLRQRRVRLQAFGDEREHGCRGRAFQVRGYGLRVGSPPKNLAQPARYAAHQPASHASAAAAPVENGATAAVASARPSNGTIAASAAAFAGTVKSGIAWNWNHAIGAVAVPQAAETAIASASLPGIG